MISLLMEIIFEYKIYVFMDSCNFCVPTVGQVLCKVLDIEWREKEKKTDPAHALMEFPVQPVPFDRTARDDRNVPHLCCPIW